MRKIRASAPGNPGTFESPQVEPNGVVEWSASLVHLYFQTHPNRARALSSPTFLHSPSFFHSSTESAHVPAPPPPQRIIVSAPQAFEPRSPRLARQQARQSPPILLSLVLAHVPRSQLPVQARVSKRFSAAAQLALYRTLELWRITSRGARDDVRAARLPTPAHGPSFVLALALALRSIGAVSALTLPPFDAERFATAPGTLSHLTLLTDTLPYAFFDGFLAAPARTRLTHFALPHFDDVPPAAAPRLAVLDISHGLAAALAPSHPLRCMTLRTAKTLYNGLRPAALFGVLGGSCSFSRSTQ
ncbi:hypothetical protein EDB85DRAFT_2297060, partial [Lactarius pseudohatsudake]